MRNFRFLIQINATLLDFTPKHMLLAVNKETEEIDMDQSAEYIKN